MPGRREAGVPGVVLSLDLKADGIPTESPVPPTPTSRWGRLGVLGKAIRGQGTAGRCQGQELACPPLGA